MWIRLYSVLFHLAFVLGLPWLVWKGWKKGKMRGGLAERFGWLDRPWLAGVSSKRPIWIHAVSVGEAQMVSVLLEGLSTRYPGVPILISTNTATGQEVARSYKQATGAFYVPLDFGWAVARVLRRLNPRLVVILETEIWPQLLYQSNQHKVPVLFLNGRISDRSFRRYLKVRPFLSHLLPCAAAFGMRSEEDAGKIIEMGAPSSKVRVLGNLKYESASHLRSAGEPIERAQYGLSEEDLVLVGGSTFPGEEAMLIRVYEQCRKSHPGLRLILAPRHPERFEEARQAIEDSGNAVARRSQGDISSAVKGNPPIVLLDKMGELKRVYRFSDLVFMGKSMGLSSPGVGGQNPLEAAAWSKPVLFGPHMGNFQEIAQALREKGGALEITNEEDLTSRVEELLNQPETRRRMGEAAFSVIESSLGAADRCLDLIAEVMDA
jgi:3-deoxy-D-manno-octulosonic-acid transferase